VAADREIDYRIDSHEELRGPEHQQMIQESRASVAGLMTDVHREADQRQRDHLLDRAATLRGDFNTFVCTGEEASGQKS
jgi:hypothetical protein